MRRIKWEDLDIIHIWESFAWKRFIGASDNYADPVQLVDKAALIEFLKSHLNDEQLEITDPLDKLVLRFVDGVDLYSFLDELVIGLPSIYQDYVKNGLTMKSKRTTIKNLGRLSSTCLPFCLYPATIKMLAIKIR